MSRTVTIHRRYLALTTELIVTLYVVPQHSQTVVFEYPDICLSVGDLGSVVVQASLREREKESGIQGMQNAWNGNRGTQVCMSSHLSRAR